MLRGAAAEPVSRAELPREDEEEDEDEDLVLMECLLVDGTP
jgi:hypothetical protein